MPEYLIALVLSAAAATGGFLIKRIDSVEDKVDRLELKVAETYVTKETLFRMFDRLESNLSRMEEKLDAHVFEDPILINRLREKYHD